VSKKFVARSETLITLIEDTKKSISFKNLNLFSQKLAHEPVLTSCSLFNLLKKV